MLRNLVCHFGEPGAILGLFENIQGGEKFDAVGRGIAQRLEQPGCGQYGDIMRLTIQDPCDLLGIQSGRKISRKG